MRSSRGLMCLCLAGLSKHERIQANASGKRVTTRQASPAVPASQPTSQPSQHAENNAQAEPQAWPSQAFSAALSQAPGHPQPMQQQAHTQPLQPSIQNDAFSGPDAVLSSPWDDHMRSRDNRRVPQASSQPQAWPAANGQAPGHPQPLHQLESQPRQALGQNAPSGHPELASSSPWNDDLSTQDCSSWQAEDGQAARQPHHLQPHAEALQASHDNDPFGRSILFSPPPWNDDVEPPQDSLPAFGQDEAEGPDPVSLRPWNDARGSRQDGQPLQSAMDHPQPCRPSGGPPLLPGLDADIYPTQSGQPWQNGADQLHQSQSCRPSQGLSEEAAWDRASSRQLQAASPDAQSYSAYQRASGDAIAYQPILEHARGSVDEREYQPEPEHAAGDPRASEDATAYQPVPEHAAADRPRGTNGIGHLQWQPSAFTRTAELHEPYSPCNQDMPLSQASRCSSRKPANGDETIDASPDIPLPAELPPVPDITRIDVSAPGAENCDGRQQQRQVIELHEQRARQDGPPSGEARGTSSPEAMPPVCLPLYTSAVPSGAIQVTDCSATMVNMLQQFLTTFQAQQQQQQSSMVAQASPDAAGSFDRADETGIREMSTQRSTVNALNPQRQGSHPSSQAQQVSVGPNSKACRTLQISLQNGAGDAPSVLSLQLQCPPPSSTNPPAARDCDSNTNPRPASLQAPARPASEADHANQHGRLHPHESPFKECLSPEVAAAHANQHGRLHPHESPFKECLSPEVAAAHANQHGRLHPHESPFKECLSPEVAAAHANQHGRLHPHESPFKECLSPEVAAAHANQHGRLHPHESPFKDCLSPEVAAAHANQHGRLHPHESPFKERLSPEVAAAHANQHGRLHPHESPFKECLSPEVATIQANRHGRCHPPGAPFKECLSPGVATTQANRHIIAPCAVAMSGYLAPSEAADAFAAEHVASPQRAHPVLASTGQHRVTDRAATCHPFVLPAVPQAWSCSQPVATHALLPTRRSSAAQPMQIPAGDTAAADASACMPTVPLNSTQQLQQQPPAPHHRDANAPACTPGPAHDPVRQMQQPAAPYSKPPNATCHMPVVALHNPGGQQQQQQQQQPPASYSMAPNAAGGPRGPKLPDAGAAETLLLAMQLAQRLPRSEIDRLLSLANGLGPAADKPHPGRQSVGSSEYLPGCDGVMPSDPGPWQQQQQPQHAHGVRHEQRGERDGMLLQQHQSEYEAEHEGSMRPASGNIRKSPRLQKKRRLTDRKSSANGQHLPEGLSDPARNPMSKQPGEVWSRAMKHLEHFCIFRWA